MLLILLFLWVVWTFVVITKKKFTRVPTLLLPTELFFDIDPAAHIHATVPVTEISLHTLSLMAGQV